MNSSWFSDKNLIDALTSAISGILGAVLGAWVAYLAAKNQYLTEYRFKKWDALRAVLIELCRNQDSLYRDLDRALPIWIARAHTRGGISKEELADLISQTAHFQTAIYAGLFNELVATEFGSELVSYNGRVDWLNQWKPKTFEEMQQYFSDYITNLANAIRIANELVPKISENIRKSPITPWGKNLDVQEFERTKPRNRFVAELAFCDFEEIEDFVKSGRRPSSFSDFLAGFDRNWFTSYIDATTKYAGWRT
jgi:hypothetical protein